jgi:hypothetical protein
MMSALSIATVSKAATGDTDVINACRCCVRSKMKHCASSLNSHARLMEWTPATPYKPEYGDFS